MSDLINKVLEFADEHEMLLGTQLVLVCVSGGADSMCLLEIMRHISYEDGFSIAVAHYNHELRGEESDRDETFVMNVCEYHGLPFYSGRGDVAHFAQKNSIGIEEAARDMRYAYFYDIAGKIGAQKIATAHTMDDNAETMLINLARGAGANGMAGIPPVRDVVIRPLLCATRAEIETFIIDRDILFVEDSTNSLDLYTRNRVRRYIMPLIKEMNPRFCEAASTAAQLFRADEEFIADIADLFIQDMCIGMTADAKDLAVLPFSVSSRVIRKLYGMGNLSYNHVKDVLVLCESTNPSASISLPGMVVYREYDRIIFDAQHKPDADEFAPIYPTPGNSYIFLKLGLKITCMLITYSDNIDAPEVHTSFTTFLFKCDDICGRIAVRPRREGDFVKLKGHSGTKTLKKLFIEKKIPVRKRAHIPIISDDKGVLGIYGTGTGSRAVPKPGDDTIVLVFEST